jgi:hypothetical protein
MEFLLTGGGLSGDKLPFPEAQVLDYAWFEENSGERPHPVATKQPIMIQSKLLYDLFGGSREWGYDGVHKRQQKKHLVGIDPQNPSGRERVVCWPDHESRRTELSMRLRADSMYDVPWPIGLRPVRTIHK